MTKFWLIEWKFHKISQAKGLRFKVLETNKYKQRIEDGADIRISSVQSVSSSQIFSNNSNH